ncbi:MAG: ornithine cyclodeaminase family protein [Betaproteobacteria bacterium]|nr:ornithine cyclodeaminase family protein [Betaproteobacteria bacterium]
MTSETAARSGPRYLTTSDLEALGLTIGRIADVIAEAFRHKAAGHVVSPPMTFFYRDKGGWFNSMVCSIPPLGFAGCKFQAGDSTNPARGLPSIQGMYILCEDAGGRMVAIIDARWLTAIRTAAVGALFARREARPGAASVGILGCGVQGRLQLQAFKEVVPTIRRCKAYDTDTGHGSRYLEEMSGRYGVEIEIVDTPEAAVRGSDIVMSSGPIAKARSCAIVPELLAPGSLYISLDRDCYVSDAAVSAMDLVFSDDREALFHAKEHEASFTSVSRVDADLGEIASGNAVTRRSADEKIAVFVNGLGIEDLAAAVEVLRRAEEKDAGLHLPPQYG